MHGPSGGRGPPYHAALLSAESSPSRLDLEANDITDAGAETLAKLLVHRNSPAGLKLGFNPISARGVATLAAAVGTSDVLVALDLNHVPCRDDGAVALARALVTNRSLEDLNLNKCKIGDDGVWELGSALAESNTTLQHIDLGGNPFGSASFEQVVESIARGNLVTVGLKTTDLRHGDAKELMQGLEANLHNGDSLKALNLRSNKLGDRGATYLAAALELGLGLRSLDVQGCSIGDDGLAALERAVSSSSQLRMLNIESNDFDPDSELVVRIRAQLDKNARLAAAELALDEADEVYERHANEIEALNSHINSLKESLDQAVARLDATIPSTEQLRSSNVPELDTACSAACSAHKSNGSLRPVLWFAAGCVVGVLVSRPTGRWL